MPPLRETIRQAPAVDSDDRDDRGDESGPHRPYAADAPGLGIVACAIMLAFGLWWLGPAEAAARRRGEGFGLTSPISIDEAAENETVRQRVTTAREFAPRKSTTAGPSREAPPVALAALPFLVVVSVNVLMSLVILPRLDVSFLAEERFNATSPLCRAPS